MGSSGGSSDFEPANTAPPPPASMISPQGQSSQYQPHFVNFLGDTNTPSTGLTPDMLAQIAASNGPPMQQGPPGGGVDQQIAELRNQLAAMQMPKPAAPKPTFVGGMGGGGSAGGRGGSSGGGGWGGH